MNTLKQIKNKIMNHIRDIKVYRGFFKNYCLLFVGFFLTEIIFRIINGSALFSWSLFRIFLIANIFGLLFALLFSLIKPKVTKYLIGGITFIVCFYSYFQIGSFNYIGAYMSINASSQLDKVTEYITDFFSNFNLSYYSLFIPFILIVLFLIFEKKLNINLELKKVRLKNQLLIGITSVFSFGILFGLTLSIDFMQNKYQAVSNLSLFKYPDNQSITVNQFGVLGFGIIDIKAKLLNTEGNIIDYKNQIVIQEDNSRNIDNSNWYKLIEDEEDTNLNMLNNYFITKKITEKNEMTGIFKDKNLIVVMLESVNNIPFYFIDQFPTLNYLYNNGITFTNNYSPRNSCSTGNNEMIGLVSLYNINNTCTANVYKNNIYPESLFNIFKNTGYNTSSYHNFIDYYYDRPTIHKNMGSEAYLNATDLGIKAKSLYIDAPSDYELMEKSLPHFINQDKYMTLLTTVTAHRPYTPMTYSDKHLDLFSDFNYRSTFKRYLSKLKELDLGLEYLLKELKKNKTLDDTVIVLYGDHYPYGLSDNELATVMGTEILKNNEKDRTPFIIYNSETQNLKVNKYTSIMNILPTILNMFDVDYDPRMYMGEDIFSEDYTELAIFADGSWQSALGFYDASIGKINYYGSDEHTDEFIITNNQRINTMIRMSNETIKKDYFNYLFKSLESYENLPKEMGSNTSNNNYN